MTKKESTIKIVINPFYGSRVPTSIRHILREKGISDKIYDGYNIIDIRCHPLLISWVEEHEEETDLRIIEIPDNVTWQIESDEEDGYEWISEEPRIWKYEKGEQNEQK